MTWEVLLISILQTCILIHFILKHVIYLKYKTFFITLLFLMFAQDVVLNFDIHAALKYYQRGDKFYFNLSTVLFSVYQILKIIVYTAFIMRIWSLANLLELILTERASGIVVLRKKLVYF